MAEQTLDHQIKLEFACRDLPDRALLGDRVAIVKGAASGRATVPTNSSRGWTDRNSGWGSPQRLTARHRSRRCSFALIEKNREILTGAPEDVIRCRMIAVFAAGPQLSD